MIRKSLFSFRMCAAIILLTGFICAQTRDDVTTINGGRDTILLRPPSSEYLPAPLAPGSVTIYSNLGTGKNVYNPSAGYGILGKIGQPWPQWVACGFRPKANHTMTEIRLGVTHNSGGNEVFVSLNEDTNSRPGKALETWHFKNLPTFGTCCKLQIAKSRKGIKVTKGKEYWVVVGTARNTSNWEVWNYNFRGAQGDFSNNIGSGWTKKSFQTLTDFGVFGK